MSAYNRETFLATLGDFSIKAADVVAYTADGKPNAFTGEIVVFNPKTGLTLDAAGIATASDISIAVGHGVQGHMAESYRFLAGQKYPLNDFRFTSRVTRPSCGVPHVIDVYVEKVEAGTTYSLEVLLDDSWVRSNMGQNERAKYKFQVTTPKGDCADCDPVGDAEQFACLFVDKINGKTQTDPQKIVRFVNHDPLKQYQPFRASQLFLTTNDGDTETSRTFCLSPQDGTCEDCAYISGITGVKIDGVTTNFTFTTNPADIDQTLPGQIDRVIVLLNEALADKGGSARLKRGVGKCCDYEIEINSCANTVALVTNSGDIEPSAAYNPYQPNDIAVVCQTCDAVAGQVTGVAGFRLFADPVTYRDYDKYSNLPDNYPAPNIFTRHLEVQAVEEDWGCTGLYTAEICAIEPPEGFGYYWEQQALHRESAGGPGKDFRNSNRYKGIVPLPDEFSKFTNATGNIKKNETYCVYNLTGVRMSFQNFNNAGANYNKSVNYMMIPQKDTTTIAAWETILAAVQARSIISGFDINCTVVITGATVTPSTLNMSVGDDEQLEAVVTPSNAIQSGTWTTSDAGVATVGSKGFVQAVGVGSATITFTASDATTTDTCAVTVS